MTPRNAERCRAILARAQGATVRCVGQSATAGPHSLHVGYHAGVARVTWSNSTDGSAVLVPLLRRRCLADLLEVRR